MGVFSRSKDIINSNINAALDRVEEPDKLIRMLIREMDDALNALRSSCAVKMSEKVQMEKELERCAEAVSRWADRSVLAVKQGKDDLAKEALIEKKKAESRKALLENDIEHIVKIIETSKVQIQELEDKLEEAVQKQSILIQRGVHAKETLQVHHSLKKADSTDTVYRFNEMEKRIERMEAEADLSGSAVCSPGEKTFQDMEIDKSVEEELQAMKKKSKSSGGK